MGAQGTATLDFGAFPGSNITSVDVSAPGVVSTSAVEAWIRPEATADHTDGDHVIAPMRVIGHYLSDNNIRIWGIGINDVMPPLEPQTLVRPSTNAARPEFQFGRQNSPMLVGTYMANWVWNGP
jgi:hypothetical protein